MKCKNCGKEIDNDSKFCDGFGAENTVSEAPAATAGNNEASPPPVVQSVTETKKQKLKFKDLPPKEKKKRAIIGGICLLLALILIFGDVFGGSSGKVKSSNNDTGAVFDMTFDEFSEKINEANADYEKLMGADKSGFDISEYWSNMVEPQVGYEETSGTEFVMYTAFLSNCVLSANVQDDDVSSVSVSYEYDDPAYGDMVTEIAISACLDVDNDEAVSIVDAICEGEAQGIQTVVYADGVMISLIGGSSSKITFKIAAVSDDFTELLENGGCRIIEW